MARRPVIHPTWLRYMVGYLVVSIVPLMLLTLVMNHVFRTEFRNEVENSTMDSMAQIGQSLESTVQQCYSIAVQACMQDAFSAGKLMTDPGAQIEMQKILANYRDTNHHLQDIAYYNEALADTVFTAYGSYHSMYYKHYQDPQGRTVPAKDLYPALSPVQGVAYADGEASRISFGDSLDIVCKLPNMRGAYLSFSIGRQTVGAMLGQSRAHTQAVLLFGAAGEPLYTWTNVEDGALDAMIPFALQSPAGQVVDFRPGEYVLKVDSPARSFTLVYLLSAQRFYANLIRMRNITLMMFLFLSGATGAVAVHLTQRQARPLIELTQLVERVFRIEPNQGQASEFDQIREAIFFVSQRNEQLTQQSEKQLRENRRLKALVGDMDGESKPTDLAQSAMDLVDRLLGDGRLNATFVSESLSCSLSNLSHQFKTTTGHTLNDYILAGKLTYACRHLEETDESVKDIAERLGYTQSGNFIRIFKSVYETTPSEYRKQKRAEAAKREQDAAEDAQE